MAHLRSTNTPPHITSGLAFSAGFPSSITQRDEQIGKIDPDDSDSDFSNSVATDHVINSRSEDLVHELVDVDRCRVLLTSFFSSGRNLLCVRGETG